MEMVGLVIVVALPLGCALAVLLLLSELNVR